MSSIKGVNLNFSKLTHKTRAIARPDPLLNFRWVINGDLPFGVMFGVDHSYVQSIDLPFGNITSGNQFMGGGYNYFPQFHDTSAFNMSMYPDSQGKTLKWILHWKSMVKNLKSNLYGLPKDFKKDISVALLDSKANPIIIGTLRGCWPTDTGNISLNYDGASTLEFTQAFSIDSSEFEVVFAPKT